MPPSWHRGAVRKPQGKPARPLCLAIVVRLEDN